MRWVAALSNPKGTISSAKRRVVVVRKVLAVPPEDAQNWAACLRQLWAHPGPHLPTPPRQKPRLGRRRGFLSAARPEGLGSVAGRPVGWRLGRDRRPAGAGNCGERSAPAGMGKRVGEVLREGLGRPAVIRGDPRSGAGLGPSSGGVPPFGGSRDGRPPGMTSCPGEG